MPLPKRDTGDANSYDASSRSSSLQENFGATLAACEDHLFDTAKEMPHMQNTRMRPYTRKWVLNDVIKTADKDACLHVSAQRAGRRFQAQ